MTSKKPEAARPEPADGRTGWPCRTQAEISWSRTSQIAIATRVSTGESGSSYQPDGGSQVSNLGPPVAYGVHDPRPAGQPERPGQATTLLGVNVPQNWS